MSFLRPSRLIIVLAFFVAAALVLVLAERSVSSSADGALDVRFSVPPGAYDQDIMLSFAAADPAAQIYYTLDGSPPDQQQGIRYDGPLMLSSQEPAVVVVRAQAFLPQGEAGTAAAGSYALGMETELPIISLIADPADLWDEARGIYVNHEQRGPEWERPVDVTYIDNGGGLSFQVGAGLRIHGGWTRYFYDKKSLRLYFREAYGARKLDVPIFGAEGQTSFDHLYLNNSDMDLLPFRNLLAESLFRQMGGFAVRGHPVLLFLNGRPWGIYTLRERIDERFLRENYGVPAAAISDTPNNIGQQTEEQLSGDLLHWQHVMDFVAEHDLSEPENYAYLQTQVDLDSFVDYYLLQMYIANVDWPHHNVHQFRPLTQGGRWEWIIWDNNMAFDRADRQMVDHVLNVEHPLGDGMELFFNKLLDNPEFYNFFLSRAADLLNTTLSAENVGNEVEHLVRQLDADIAVEKARWNVPAEWTAVVEHMRDFAATRTAIMRSQIVESFELPGTATLTVEQDGGPAGWLAVNDLLPQPLPYQGIQFVGTTLRLRALAPSGYAFAGWVGYDGPDDAGEPDIRLAVESDISLQVLFMPLEAGSLVPGDVVINAYHVDDSGDIEGDWFELEVRRPGGVDLRGWRVSDNDSPAAEDEGALIFGDDPLLADLSQGDRLRVVATVSSANDRRFARDGRSDGLLTLYLGNGRIVPAADGWFNLGSNDNLTLFAPDDRAIDLWTTGHSVTRADFGLPPAP